MRTNMTIYFVSFPIALGGTELLFMAVVLMSALPSCSARFGGRDPVDEISDSANVIVRRTMEVGAIQKSLVVRRSGITCRMQFI
jgi:hypothetical protein